MGEKVYECSVDEIVNEVFGELKNKTEVIQTHIEDEPKLKRWSEATHEERNKIFEEDPNDMKTTSRNDWIYCFIFISICSLTLYIIKHI